MIEEINSEQEIVESPIGSDVDSTLRVISLNVGGGLRDWHILQTHLGESLGNEHEFDQLQTTVCQEIIKWGPDAFLLQEFKEQERALTSALEVGGYQLFMPERNGERGPNTAIALKRERFDLVEERHGWHPVHPGSRLREISVVTATDRLNGGLISFISGHVPGLSFEEVKMGDKESQMEQIMMGDTYCRHIGRIVSDLPGAVVVGTDMNANPEILAGLSNRFADLEASGLSLLRTGRPTNVNILDRVDPKREIDFLFTRGFEGETASFVPGFEQPQTWLSDHAPITADLSRSTASSFALASTSTVKGSIDRQHEGKSAGSM